MSVGQQQPMGSTAFIHRWDNVVLEGDAGEARICQTSLLGTFWSYSLEVTLAGLQNLQGRAVSSVLFKKGNPQGGGLQPFPRPV